MKKIIYSFIFLALTVLLLVFPRESFYLALSGLNLWFQKMVPTLFPFMILSGMMIRLNLTEKFMVLFNPILKPLFRLRLAPLYAIAAGFLCGFPMGARIVADLYGHQKISKNEAQYLLSFVNNIGPIYFLSFALPLINLDSSPALSPKLSPAFSPTILSPTLLLPTILFGMYGIPLCYGLFLRYAVYRNKITPVIYTPERKTASMGFLKALDDSITAGIEGITKLGGYMIFFNMLNIIPHRFINNGLAQGFLSGMLEISGGLKALGSKIPLLSLTLLVFGGFSCLAQTYSCIAKTDLSIKSYFIHKIILTLLALGYYAFILG
ncbi:MAG: hypothetical protein FWG91_08540 [Lachnospiraceae bacterium]|nr:hypothetical protein [Lachnospiraceae bacterium]